jgi:hypothetical protein
MTRNEIISTQIDALGPLSEYVFIDPDKAGVPTEFAIWEERAERIKLWEAYSVLPLHTDEEISAEREYFETDYFERTGHDLLGYDPSEDATAAQSMRAELSNLTDAELFEWFMNCNCGNSLPGDFIYSMTGWTGNHQAILQAHYDEKMKQAEAAEVIRYQGYKKLTEDQQRGYDAHVQRREESGIIPQSVADWLASKKKQATKTPL